MFCASLSASGCLVLYLKCAPCPLAEKPFPPGRLPGSLRPHSIPCSVPRPCVHPLCQPSRVGGQSPPSLCVPSWTQSLLGAGPSLQPHPRAGPVPGGAHRGAGRPSRLLQACRGFRSTNAHLSSPLSLSLVPSSADCLPARHAVSLGHLPCLGGFPGQRNREGTGRQELSASLPSGLCSDHQGWGQQASQRPSRVLRWMCWRGQSRPRGGGGKAVTPPAAAAHSSSPPCRQLPPGSRAATLVPALLRVPRCWSSPGPCQLAGSS